MVDRVRQNRYTAKVKMVVNSRKDRKTGEVMNVV